MSDPIEIDFERASGFSMRAVRTNEMAQVEVAGFHSFEEGQIFYKLLDGFTGMLQNAGHRPSQTDRFLAIHSPQKTVLFIDDALPYNAVVRSRRKIEAGEMIGKNDIAGVDRIVIEREIVIPADAGISLMLSHRWKRAFFFDYRPHDTNNARPIDYDIEVIGGQILSHLFFTELFTLSELEWERTIAAGWFPFVWLQGDLWDHLHAAIDAGRPDQLDEENAIHECVRKTVDEKFSDWIKKDPLTGEEQFIRRAVDAYKSEDWLTVVAMLYPRIEGIISRSTGHYGRQADLLAKFTEKVSLAAPHNRSLLFPKQLERYFARTFFQYVDFRNDQKTLNRHSFAHGIVEADSVTRSSALKLLLLIDHLFYCLPSTESKSRQSLVKLAT